jgi:hypothetical protein
MFKARRNRYLEPIERHELPSGPSLSAGRPIARLLERVRGGERRQFETAIGETCDRREVV